MLAFDDALSDFNALNEVCNECLSGNVFSNFARTELLITLGTADTTDVIKIICAQK